MIRAGEEVQGGCVSSISPKSEARLAELTEKHDLSAAADVLRASAVEAVGLILYSPSGEIQLGENRYGGTPDLPESVPWP